MTNMHNTAPPADATVRIITDDTTTPVVNPDMDAELTALITDCMGMLKDGTNAEQVADHLREQSEEISTRYNTPLPTTAPASDDTATSEATPA